MSMVRTQTHQENAPRHWGAHRVFVLLFALLWYAPLALAQDGFQLVSGDPNEGDNFGFAIAISKDFAVVTAPGDDEVCGSASCDGGAAYVFARQTDGSWTQVKKLTAPSAGPASEVIGTTAAISGAWIVIAGDQSDAGGVDSGVAYVFNRHQGGPDNWGFVKQLLGSGSGPGDRFGQQLAMQGSLLAIAGYSGTYLFEQDLGGPGNWGELPVSMIGGSLALDGDTMAHGDAVNDENCPPEVPNCNTGAVIILQRDQGGPGNWGEVTRVHAPGAPEGAYFGWSVALEGDLLAVGAIFAPGTGTNSGAVYLFKRDLGGPGNWGFSAEVVGTNTADSDWFGSSVALSGHQLVVGARAGDCPGLTDTGIAYLFSRSGPDAWSEARTFCADSPAENDLFGAATALSPGLGFFGAREADDGCTSPPNCGTGSAFVFELSIFEDTFESGDISAWDLSSS